MQKWNHTKEDFSLDRLRSLTVVLTEIRFPHMVPESLKPQIRER
jgi:hypothetical protein